MREDIKEIYSSAIKEVLPKNLIQKNEYLQSFTNKNTYLFGSGKASISMAVEIEKLFGDKIIDGVVVSPYKDESLKRVRVIESSHPIPSYKSLEAGKILYDKLSSLEKDDFFIYMLSGGSSALIELLHPLISLKDLEITTTLLLQNAVPIEEINTVRKHLSLIKGGQLGACTKACGVVLVISDVIGDDLEAIGSAPLFFDSSTILDAKEVLLKYELFERVPENVKELFDRFLNETPKKPNENIEHIIIGSNKIALKEARCKALSLGYSCDIVTDSLQGDVKLVAKKIVEAILQSNSDVLLFGGECTVKVIGSGKGGRNQELALRVLELIKNHTNITFLSAGSDGIDGNSKAAGGIVDSKSYREDLPAFLENSDSYHYLKRGNDLLVTDESGTNVMDIMIALKGDTNV